MANEKHLLPIQETKGKASHKWQAVRSYLLSKVSSGTFNPGDALPSENYLCDKVHVSRSTVRQAFRELENEGIVYRIRGKGTFLSNMKSSQNLISHEMFAVIVPGVRRSLYPSLTQGFDDFLYSENYQTMICQTYNDVDKQGNIILRLLHRGIDGIAIVPSTSGKTPAFQIQLLIDNRIPVVLCHRGVRGVAVPTLTWDREEVGRMAGSLLLNSGHRDIGYFGVYKYEVAEAHVRGLRQVMAEAGFDLPEERVVFGPTGEGPDREVKREKMMAEILLADRRPSAIVCSDDNEAEALYWLSQRMGIRVPDELSIVGFGDCHRNSVFRGLLTSVVIDEYELGIMAAQMLYRMKKSGNVCYEPQPRMLELRLSDGRTVQRR